MPCHKTVMNVLCVKTTVRTCVRTHLVVMCVTVDLGMSCNPMGMSVQVLKHFFSVHIIFFSNIYQL